MDPKNPLELECLQGFDHSRFGVLARALQVLLGHGAVDYAVAAVRQFAQQTRRRVATPSSQLVDVISIRTANALEQIGCTTVAAFLMLQDAEVLAVPNVGERVLADREQLRRELAAGVRLEEYGSDEDLAFDFFAADVPRDVLDYVEGRMNQSLQNVSVMDALRVLAERGNEAAREIDVKIASLNAEIAQLKKMRSMLGVKAVRKPTELSDKYKPIADAMAKVLVDGVSDMPGKIAPKVNASPIIVGKIAKEDSRFMRCEDGRICLA